MAGIPGAEYYATASVSHTISARYRDTYNIIHRLSDISHLLRLKNTITGTSHEVVASEAGKCVLGATFEQFMTAALDRVSWALSVRRPLLRRVPPYN